MILFQIRKWLVYIQTSSYLGRQKQNHFFSEMKLTIVPTANSSSSLLLFKLLTSHFGVVFDKTNDTFNNLSRNQFIVGFQASTWFIRWSKRVCWNGTDSGGNWKGVVSGWSLHYHSLRRNTLACFFLLEQTRVLYLFIEKKLS